MKTRLVPMGRSQGIRIPKPLIDQAGLQRDVEIEVGKNSLIIRPRSKPRSDWESRIKKELKKGDNHLLDPEVSSLSTWDQDEWEW